MNTAGMHTVVPVHDIPASQGLALDTALLEAVAANGGRRAAVWSSRPALIVSRRDSRLAGFAGAVEEVAIAFGVPVEVRSSGGTAVMQGPDIVTLSLAYETPSGAAVDMNAAYGALLSVLDPVFDSSGIRLGLGPVEGAYCDGAHNIVAGGRKLAGTAQWRRKRAYPAVLVHAAILVSTDLRWMNEVINGFYSRAGQPAAYKSDVCTTVGALAPQLANGFAARCARAAQSWLDQGRG